MGSFITQKADSFMKIIGWMLLTLMVILGAIKLAAKFTDRVDGKPAKTYTADKEE